MRHGSEYTKIALYRIAAIQRFVCRLSTNLQIPDVWEPKVDADELLLREKLLGHLADAFRDV